MAGMDTVEKVVWLALIEETGQALSSLHAEELEALAVRAESALEGTNRDQNLRYLSGTDLDEDRRRNENLQEVAARHRVLGDLLGSTAGNLAVLWRLLDPEANSRWAR